MTFDLEMIREVYSRFPERVPAAPALTGKPLTLAEKILYTHLWDGKADTVGVFGVGISGSDSIFSQSTL